MQEFNLNKAYVQTTTLSKDNLKDCVNNLENLDNDLYCYFLKWVDKVELKVNSSLEFSPEGQLFNSELELRWKQKKDKYEVILLSTKQIKINKFNFKSLGENWIYQNRKGIVYPETETRLPKPIKTQGVNINQRYFIDNKTSTIHFIALTTAKL